MLPLARSTPEARLFLRLQPCPACGGTGCDYRSAVTEADGVLCARYRGTCARCGEEREYRFRLPDAVVQQPPGAVRFGGPEPSELLDPGVWLWYSEVCARQVPDGSAGLAAAERHTLATALAAVEETLKFLPAGASEVPSDAFTSVDGRAMWTREPGRFQRDRLAAVRDHYAARLARA